MAIGSVLRSSPISVWQLDEVASTAAVLATVRVEHITHGNSRSESPNRTVLGRAELVVLQAFPASAPLPGQHIQLEYEQLPEENSPMKGPDVPLLRKRSVLAVLN